MVNMKKSAAKKIFKHYAKLRAKALRRKWLTDVEKRAAAPTAPMAGNRATENLRGDRKNGNGTRIIINREESAAVPERPFETNSNQRPREIIRINGREIRLPASSFLPLHILLSLLAYALSPNDMRRLHCFYQQFRARNITRQTLIDRIRLLAGDNLLTRILDTFGPLIRRRLMEYIRTRDER